MKYASSVEQIEAIKTGTFLDRNEKGQFYKGMRGAGTTHGMFGTKFYFKYFAIVQRCNDPKATSYPRYGALGIKNEWNSFEEFRDDMYESYLLHVEEFGQRQTTIDRIDSRGNYCKTNCRWATMKEQARNKKNNNRITIGGETMTAVEWSEKTGVRKQTILSRYRRGWRGERLISTKRHHRYEHTESK